MKISLVICVWNTSHLLKRSIETYIAQDFPKDDWELIVVDDNSFDDVREAIKPAEGKINIKYIRLDHNYGMRGNTVAFNTGFDAAEGEIIAETTPETMFTSNTIRTLYEPHTINKRCFVAMKTYNLTYDLQMNIDTVNWREDLENIKQLEGFNNEWTLNNVKTTHFGTHQTCSIRKIVWDEMTNKKGYPLFGDYGCLEGGTKVLTADLKWVRNDSLKAGDTLVGVNEFSTKNKKRKFEKSVVQKIGEVLLPSYEVITADGKKIVASEDHLWLVRRKRDMKWIPTKELELGDKIKRVSDIWETEDNFESGWIAGIIDGEGGIEKGSGLRINITQNPGDVLERIKHIYTKWGIDFSTKKRYEVKGEWHGSRKGKCHDIRTKNTISALKVLGKCPVTRLKDRWVDVRLPLGKGDLYSEVTSLNFVGDRKLIGMTTSTKTFISEGLVSHNSDDPWYSGTRSQNNIEDITIMEPMIVHQWHLPFNYFASMGYAPMLNRFNHSKSNYMNDKTGHVPSGGTSAIWDRANPDKDESMPDHEKLHWAQCDSQFLNTGGDPKVLRPRIYTNAVS